MTKMSRHISYGKEFQAAKDAAVEQAYMLAKAAYGPSAHNVGIEINYGDPLVSRDGVTNLRKLYLENPDENLVARIIVQASEKSNKTVGDGTSAVVILAYHLYQQAMRLIGSGHNHMAVKRQLERSAVLVLEELDKLKTQAKPDNARNVAKVSASDGAIGEMVADVIDRVGVDGNIIVEEFDGSGSYDEEVNGFYFRKGFTHEFLVNNITALESRLNDISVFVTEKPLKTASDIAPILSKIIAQSGRGAELLIVGEVSDEALSTLALNKVNENIFVTLVDVPAFGPLRNLFLEDVAVYTGATVYATGAKASSFDINMLGGAEKVIVTPYSTTIINGDANKEVLSNRINDLQKQLTEATSLVDKEEIRKRLSSLSGKVSIVHVGASTGVERKEVKLRVEDAIAATQSALRDGIVPGGGVALARASYVANDFKDTFASTFMTLAENSGFNPSEAFFKMMSEKETWMGYDFLNSSLDTPVNLLEFGIIDPAEAIKESVRNAVSVVGTLITMGVGITFIDRDMKSD